MRINVNGGHTRRAPGASGYLDELAEDRLVKDALVAELRARGHEVSDSTTDEATVSADLREQCRRANASGAEVAVSVHFNACPGGTGTEVWHYAGSSAQGLAADMSARVAKALGLRDRGAKATTQLYWLRHTDMPAVLVEACFVDSAGDAEAYRRVGPAAVARAIADAIVGGAAQPAPEVPEPQPAPEVPEPQPAPDATGPAPEGPRRLSIAPGTYRCQVDHLRVRTGPGLGYPEVAHYDEGETVELDAWCVEADGWVWGTYEDWGGTRRYIAVGPYTGEPDAGRDYLVKA